jgi:type IV pilus assembly protein PilN
MQIIEKLQRSRPEIVHVFDELVRTRARWHLSHRGHADGQRLKIEGVAQSSTRVSTFMRNIDGSQWLRKDPELEVVETKPGQTLGASFTLFASQVTHRRRRSRRGGRVGRQGRQGQEGKPRRQAGRPASGR